MGNTQKVNEDPLPHLPGSIRQRIFLGMGATALGQVIELASRLLLVPIYLYAWDIQSFGKWQVLIAGAAFFSLADCGGQLHISNSLTQAYAQQNIRRFRRLLHSGLAIFLVLPGVIVGALLISSALGFPVCLARICGISGGSFCPTFSLLVLQVVLSFPLGVLFGAYRAIGRGPRAAMLANGLAVLRFLFVAGGLLAGFEMAGLALLGNVPFLLIGAFALAEMSNKYPQFGLPWIKSADSREMRAMIRPSLEFCIIQASNMMWIYGPVILIGWLFGALEVVVFSTLLTLVRLSRQFMALIFNASWPEITRLDKSGDVKHTYDLLCGLERTILAFVALYFMLLHIFGETIYHFWLHGRVAFRGDVLAILLLYMLQKAFWNSSANYLMAVNQHRGLSLRMSVSVLLGMFLAFAGGRTLGLLGVPIGLLIGDLLLIAWAAPLLLWRYRREFTIWFHIGKLLPLSGILLAVYLDGRAMAIGVPFVLVWWYMGCPRISAPAKH